MNCCDCSILGYALTMFLFLFLVILPSTPRNLTGRREKLTPQVATHSVPSRQSTPAPSLVTADQHSLSEQVIRIGSSMFKLTPITTENQSVTSFNHCQEPAAKNSQSTDSQV